MPSDVLHIALAGLIAAALLGDELDLRALAVVVGVTLIPDLDTLLGLAIGGAHRALLHNIFIPILGVVLVYLLRDSIIRRWGVHGLRVAGVSVISLTFAGIAPDLFYNGINLLYPLQDRFVVFNGELYYSTVDGLVVSLFEPIDVGTTQTLHYSTGIDPVRGADRGEERVFPIAMSGIQFVVSFIGYGVMCTRLWLNYR